MSQLVEGAAEKNEAKSKTTRGSKRLPAERRARKRELDRQAQHDTRQKTKNYIAHLENIVDSLREPNGSDTWIAQIEEKRRLNEQLAATLRSIGRIAETTLKLTEQEAPSKKINESEQSTSPDELPLAPSEDMAIDFSTSRQNLMAARLDPSNAFPHNGSNYSDSLLNLFPPLENEPWTVLENVIPKSMPLVHVQHYCGPEWLYTKRLLLQCKNFRDYANSNEATDVEIPVQAILRGWDVVDQMYTLSPLWKILRQSDEGMFFNCTQSHRLAAMVIMHMEMKVGVIDSLSYDRLELMTIQYLAYPSHKNLMALPVYLRPRPCQKFITHNPIIDFFPWPGVRELMIFSEHDFCPTTFSRAFHANNGFTWPFDFSDAYVRTSDVGVLELSRPFLEKLHDVQSWTMDAPFFESFPQLRGEIPMSNSIISSPRTPVAPLQPPVQQSCLANPAYVPNQIPIPAPQRRPSQMSDAAVTSDQRFAMDPAGIYWTEQMM